MRIFQKPFSIRFKRLALKYLRGKDRFRENQVPVPFLEQQAGLVLTGVMRFSYRYFASTVRAGMERIP
jgi:hypothetical protein